MAAYEQLVSVSGAATNGQIPQANGSGGYAWVTPAAGVNPSSATPAMDGTGAAGTSADYARGDHVHPTDTSRAPLASPTFTGTPSAPTAAAGTNTTQLATTAFVTTAVANKSVPTATTTTPKMDGTAAVGSETKWAKGDHVHPTDTSRAPLASPALTGTPTAPTASAGTNTTQIATTAFVTTAVANKAPLASPALTGTPTAPTAASGTANTQIATTEFVANALGNNSGILKVNCGALSVLPTTINSSDITATMELVRAEVGTTDVQDGDWTVTTANGSVTISGSISGATSLVLYLSEVRTAS